MQETWPSDKVLIVEDDAAQRTTLCDLIRDAGFAPVACATGEAALTQADRMNFPVAVVDYRLPDLTGVQVLERIRERLGRVRVILHTAYGSFESARDALNHGAFAYVEKGGDPAQLLREVRRAVDESMAELVWELDESLFALADQAPDLILQLDPEGTITHAGRSLAGYPSEQLLGTPLQEWVAPEHRDCLAAAVRDVFAEGRAQSCEVAVEGLDGLRYRYACRLGPVVAGGRVTRSVVVARDVTEDRLRETVDELIRILVQNAREAMGPRGKLTIETERVMLDDAHAAENPGLRTGPHWTIAVADDGCGMTDSALERIFEPFYTSKTRGGAAGLGLTRLYALVAEASGHVVVESEPGRGTVFRIFLPEPRPEAPPVCGDGRADDHVLH